VNQSKLQAKTCSRREARENLREQVTISFGFTYDSMKKRREFFGRQSLSVIMQNQSKREFISRSLCLLCLDLRQSLEVTKVTRRYLGTLKKATFLLKLAFLQKL